MHHRHLLAEALHEAAGRLRGERDLGNQHDRRALALERGGHGAQVDLGLAAAGDAVQQERAQLPRSGAARPEAGLDLLKGSRLAGGELHRAGTRAHALDPRPPQSVGGVLEPQQAAPLEAAQRGVRAPGPARERGGAQGCPRQRLQRRPLARTHPRAVGERRLAGGGDRRPQRALRAQRPARTGAGAGREHEREPASRGGDVLTRDPESQGDERLRDVRLQRGDRLRQPLRRQLALVGHVHDHSEQPPAPERHDQHASHAHVLKRTCEPVVERPAQAARRGERLDLGDHSHEATDRSGRRPGQAAAARTARSCSRPITRSRASTHAESNLVPDSSLSSSRALSSVQAGR